MMCICADSEMGSKMQEPIDLSCKTTRMLTSDEDITSAIKEQVAQEIEVPAFVQRLGAPDMLRLWRDLVYCCVVKRELQSEESVWFGAFSVVNVLTFMEGVMRDIILGMDMLRKDILVHPSFPLSKQRVRTAAERHAHLLACYEKLHFAQWVAESLLVNSSWQVQYPLSIDELRTVPEFARAMQLLRDARYSLKHDFEQLQEVERRDYEKVEKL